MTNKIRWRIRSLLCNKSGQVIPIVAVMFVAIAAMAGLTVDGGRLYWTKRRVQGATDAAAYGAAHELQRGNTDYSSRVRPAALRDATLNGYSDANSTITVNNPPTSGLQAGNNRFVEVIIDHQLPMTFAHFLGREGVTVRSRSVAGRISYADICMLALNPSLQAALRIRGSANLLADCGLMSNSRHSAGLQFEGSMSVNASWLGAVGGANREGSSGTVSPDPDQGVPPAMDPFAYLQPPNYAGWPAGSYNVATRTYVCPGGQCVFNSRLNIGGPAGNKTFQPGIYVLRDGMEVTSSNVLTGNGVCFYNTGPGNIRLAGSSVVTLTPPTSGPYKGILFYVDRNAPAGIINEFGVGTADFLYRGVIYAPTQKVVVEGSFIGGMPWGMVVADTIDLAGSASLNIHQPPSNEAPDVTKVFVVE